MKYIGFWVTWNEIGLINKKIEVIVNIMPPKKTFQVREFIGLINYYRDIQTKHSHLLQPITTLPPDKVTLKWAYIEQNLFEDIKLVFSLNTLLAYLDFNKVFDIHKYDIN